MSQGEIIDIFFIPCQSDTDSSWGEKDKDVKEFVIRPSYSIGKFIYIIPKAIYKFFSCYVLIDCMIIYFAIFSTLPKYPGTCDGCIYLFILFYFLISVHIWIDHIYSASL